ncbi:D-alanyl-D-alanine carboxypeptidase family protein [Protaetiibacter mangrovi]|uniref:D-alanyl-D-alanine carboxypeptidase n=1 Tax=Protaetiibacter mangrovi TaxID=2970926 RepID=A0ABT1ZCY3_9MICO|nr:D-alanyl-D-alanine carboxypeptidase [Protaetiibacter mangrovi]MCS0498568.1 D-alanyl-D-alanine carboxypeptidase [Protaetiibacter mangrovi]TPX03989.1 D-alanyl-D-alanine carboxypeptidase [Schumannella luteola]
MAYRDEPSDGVGQLTALMRGAEATEGEPVDPVERRRRRRRRLIATGVVVAVVLGLLGGYAGYTLSAPLPAATGEIELPASQSGPVVVVATPPDGASAISITGGDDYLGPELGGIPTSNGGDDPRPMASITKLVTALVILDAHPLAGPDDPGPTITFDKADHDLYDAYYVRGATIAAMPTGSSMSLHDALEMMLVVSATNYADAVATWAFGSRAAYLRATKDWLAANGFSRTTVVEPTGLDPGSTSTPSELLALGRLAMANASIASIVGLPALDVPGLAGQGNTNSLLGVQGIRGIKTGTLDTSNLLFSSQLDVGIGEPLDVTGVVLGGFSHDTVSRDVRAWLESIRSGFHEVTAAEQGQLLGVYTTPWGESARVVVGETATLLTWSDTPIVPTMSSLQLTSGADGEQLGELTWTAGSRAVTVPVLLDGAISPPDQWWRLTHPFELG